MRKTNAFSTNDIDAIIRLVDSDLYMTAVATRHKISDDVLDILPGILDSLQEMLDNKDCTNRRDNQYYVSQMFRSATEAQAWHQLPGTTDVNTHNVVVNGLAALLRRPVSSPRVFKSPAGIMVQAWKAAHDQMVDGKQAKAEDWIVSAYGAKLVYTDADFRLHFTPEEERGKTAGS